MVVRQGAPGVKDKGSVFPGFTVTQDECSHSKEGPHTHLDTAEEEKLPAQVAERAGSEERLGTLKYA